MTYAEDAANARCRRVDSVLSSLVHRLGGKISTAQATRKQANMRRFAASWFGGPIPRRCCGQENVCTGLSSISFDWAEEKSQIRQLTGTEAALTASETREEVVAGL
jgi:hypothetical protein